MPGVTISDSQLWQLLLKIEPVHFELYRAYGPSFGRHDQTAEWNKILSFCNNEMEPTLPYTKICQIKVEMLNSANFLRLVRLLPQNQKSTVWFNFERQ